MSWRNSLQISYFWLEHWRSQDQYVWQNNVNSGSTNYLFWSIQQYCRMELAQVSPCDSSVDNRCRIWEETINAVLLQRWPSTCTELNISGSTFKWSGWREPSFTLSLLWYQIVRECWQTAIRSVFVSKVVTWVVYIVHLHFWIGFSFEHVLM